MRFLHCCTAISALQIEIAFDYILVIGRDQKPMFLERTNDMNIARSFAQWRSYRNTVSELNGLSNRELDDLGIGRSDIKRIARQATK